jgi:hypothetical protein
MEVSMVRALWQILIEIAKPVRTALLDCDECFYYLEYMSEMVVVIDEELITLEALRRHVENCPGCREHHLQRIRELEESFKLDQKK